ncbi:unnamed protein product [Fusarium langsethiae]|nr:unnamed protein product [Fusarium langsethiae]
MENFCRSWMIQLSSGQDTSIALRDICIDWKDSQIEAPPPSRLIQQLLALGADPHAVGPTSTMKEPLENGESVIQETSAFELFLRSTFHRLFEGDYEFLPAALEVIDIMAPTCPDLRRRIIVTISDINWDGSRSRSLKDWEYCIPRQDYAAFEVDMQYLLERLLAAIAFCGIPTQGYKVHEIANSAVDSYSRFRHFTPEGQEGEEEWSDQIVFCYRIINQERFKDMCDDTFWSSDSTEWSVQRLMDGLHSKDPEYDSLLGNCELVVLADEINQLASEDLGIHKVTDRKVDDQLDMAVVEV